MGADYKNWMPKGMVASLTGGAVESWITALGVHILMPEGTVEHVMTGVSTAAGVLFSGVSVWSYLMYRAFDYNGKRQMSRQIISGIADYVDLPEEGSCLDVGCGSGALADYSRYGKLRQLKRLWSSFQRLSDWLRLYIFNGTALCRG